MQRHSFIFPSNSLGMWEDGHTALNSDFHVPLFFVFFLPLSLSLYFLTPYFLFYFRDLFGFTIFFSLFFFILFPPRLPPTLRPSLAPFSPPRLFYHFPAKTIMPFSLQNHYTIFLPRLSYTTFSLSLSLFIFFLMHLYISLLMARWRRRLKIG